MDKIELLETLLEKDILNEEEKTEIKKLMVLVAEQRIEISELQEQLKGAYFEGPYYKVKPKQTFELK